MNFTNAFHRADSKLYILDESYGGMRSALLARSLQEDASIPLAGVIMVSPYLSTQMGNFKPRATFEDELAVASPTVPGSTDDVEIYAGYLPSYAVSAWYYQRSRGPWAKFNNEEAIYKSAKAFAFGRYRAALEQGNELPESEFHAVADEMSEMLGISQTRIESWNLRLKAYEFFSELLNDRKLVVGRYDARYKALRLQGQNGNSAVEPSDVAAGFAINGAATHFFTGDLHFKNPIPYKSSATISKWPTGING